MSPSQRTALGRGLSALIPATGKGAAGVDSVDIDLISPNPQQPRMSFNSEALNELAQSIREHGVLQPVIVTQLTSDLGPVTYQLIAGERRLQAAKLAGVTHMPVVIREAVDSALLELALVENIQRQDLNPIEEAMAFNRLQHEYGLTQEEIANRIGRGRVAIANRLRLLTLHEDIRMSLASGQISEGHARALLAIEDDGMRIDAWRRIVSDNLTVRQAEEIAQQLRSTAKTKTTYGEPDRRVVSRQDAIELRSIEKDLRTALGAKVAVTRNKNGGRIIITFFNDEELETLITRIVGP